MTLKEAALYRGENAAPVSGKASQPGIALTCGKRKSPRPLTRTRTNSSPCGGRLLRRHKHLSSLAPAALGLRCALATLSGKADIPEGTIKGYMKPGGEVKCNAERMQRLARALHGGFLITGDEISVELYGEDE